jgi:hypothetical protein
MNTSSPWSCAAVGTLAVVFTGVLFTLGCAPEPLRYPEGHPAEARANEGVEGSAPMVLDPAYVPPLPPTRGTDHHHPHHHEAKKSPTTGSKQPPSKDEDESKSSAPDKGPATHGGHEHGH